MHLWCLEINTIIPCICYYLRGVATHYGATKVHAEVINKFPKQYTWCGGKIHVIRSTKMVSKNFDKKVPSGWEYMPM